MIWIAALMMAAQAGGATGVSQPSPAVTAQEKQELSNYKFKAAAAALNAQTNQSVPKPNPSTPIPPLQVPPVTNQRPIVPSSPDRGTATEKGSGVPPNWKPPHAELNNAAVERSGCCTAMGDGRGNTHAWALTGGCSMFSGRVCP